MWLSFYKYFMAEKRKADWKSSRPYQYVISILNHA